MRITYGPGYRIYYGETETTIVVLLCGGTKPTQKKDVAKAQQYWADYKSTTTQESDYDQPRANKEEDNKEPKI